MRQPTLFTAARVVALSLLLVVTAAADAPPQALVELRDGRVFRGKITDANAVRVRIRVAHRAEQEILRTEVEKIHYGTDDELLKVGRTQGAAFLRALATTYSSATEKPRLRAIFDVLIELDPDDAATRASLGHVRLGERWLPISEAGAKSDAALPTDRKALQIAAPAILTALRGHQVDAEPGEQEAALRIAGAYRQAKLPSEARQIYALSGKLNRTHQGMCTVLAAMVDRHVILYDSRQEVGFEIHGEAGWQRWALEYIRLQLSLSTYESDTARDGALANLIRILECRDNVHVFGRIPDDKVRQVVTDHYEDWIVRTSKSRVTPEYRELLQSCNVFARKIAAYNTQWQREPGKDDPREYRALLRERSSLTAQLRTATRPWGRMHEEGLVLRELLQPQDTRFDRAMTALQQSLKSVDLPADKLAGRPRLPRKLELPPYRYWAGHRKETYRGVREQRPWERYGRRR